MSPSAVTRQSSLPAPEQLLSRRVFLVLALCLVVAVFAIYSPSLGFQFIIDDHRYTADARIRDAGHVWEYFTSFVWAQFKGGPNSFYRPAFLLWMRFNFLLNGLDSWGWHLLSILKHILVAVLLGRLVWKLLRDSAAALSAATLFALHPAHTESVSWVTVPDPLVGAGLLIALLSYFHYVQPVNDQIHRTKTRKRPKPETTKSGKWLVVSAAAYFAALLAKETAIVFPVIIFAVSLSSSAQQSASQDQPTKDVAGGATWKRLLRHTLPFIAATGLYLLLRFNALGVAVAANTQQIPRTSVILSWPAILWFYTKAIFWPWRPYSFADPITVGTFSAREVLLPTIKVVGAMALVAAVSLWALASARRNLSGEKAVRVRSAIVIGIFLLILPLVPALNLNGLNPGDFLHGRYTYLSLLGLMLLLAVALSAAEQFRSGLLFASGGLAIAFSVSTVAQEKQWKDDATVYAIAHKIAPNNQVVAQNLADTHVEAAIKLGDEGRCNEAIPILQQVIRDFPQDWKAWAAQGNCYVQLNNLVAGEDSLHRAATLSKNSTVIQYWQELRAHMGLPSASLPK
jgi:protein O-mannosyl-transferase